MASMLSEYKRTHKEWKEAFIDKGTLITFWKFSTLGRVSNKASPLFIGLVGTLRTLEGYLQFKRILEKPRGDYTQGYLQENFESF